MTITIDITCDDSILGGREYSPELTITLDERGHARIVAGERHNANMGTPMDIHHGRTRSWGQRLSQGCLAVADCEKLASLGERIRPLLERLHAGHSVTWDGSNMRGRLTEDAQDADLDLQMLIERAQWVADTEVWYAEDWVSESWRDTADKIGLTAGATDEHRRAAERKLIEIAQGDGIRLYEADKAVDWLIEQLDEEAAEQV